MDMIFSFFAYFNKTGWACTHFHVLACSLFLGMCLGWNCLISCNSSLVVNCQTLKSPSAVRTFPFLCILLSMCVSPLAFTVIDGWISTFCWEEFILGCSFKCLAFHSTLFKMHCNCGFHGLCIHNELCDHQHVRLRLSLSGKLPCFCLQLFPALGTLILPILHSSCRVADDAAFASGLLALACWFESLPVWYIVRNSSYCWVVVGYMVLPHCVCQWTYRMFRLFLIIGIWL